MGALTQAILTPAEIQSRLPSATESEKIIPSLPRTPEPPAKLPPVSTREMDFRDAIADDEESPPSSITRGPDDKQPEGTTDQLEKPDVRSVMGMLISTNFSMFLGGMNDAATGALIPYMQPAYRIGLLFVALVYLTNFAGWMVAAFLNVHLTAQIGMGGVLVFGAGLQLFAYCLNFWKPPYPLFVISFFFTGLGMAVQDAQANVFCANVKDSHRYLGLLHSLFGAGALVGPLIATSIAAHTAYWNYFYLITLGLSVLNICLLAWTFRVGLFKGTKKARESAGSDFMGALKQPTVLVFSAFFFLYVGAEVTAGGWVVEFLIRVRKGTPSKVGYVASGFWGGLTLGRFGLADITHRFGERRMLAIYICLCLAVQLVFWFVPDIVTDAVMISLLGVFLGPSFPTGISIMTKLLPRELHTAAIGFSSTVGMAGSAAFPFMTGAVAAKAGVGVLQPILVALLVGMGVFLVFVPKLPRPTV
ncbi:hypothetical protein RUND412_005440 [Rhizina undulata]